MRLLALIAVICNLVLINSCTSSTPADAIYVNGVIWTGGASVQEAQAIAVTDDRITAVGTNDEVLVHAKETTTIIDLGGTFVVPGFIDNHTHFLSGGFQLASVDLRDARTPAEFSARMRDFTRTRTNDEWITGGDWDHELWGGALPQHDWIDSSTANQYVFISRLDGHMALANSRVLELAGITAETPDPEGGTIVHDPQTGEPTGILKDEAMNLVYRIMPASTQAGRREALDRAVKHALSKGLTQVYDMGLWSHFETYKEAADAGRLPIRIYSFVPIYSWAEMSAFVGEYGKGGEWLRWGGVKGFVDGSLGSTTAWFYEAYEDDPSTTGLLTTDTTRLAEMIIAADSAGLHVAIHAIGDRANDWLLNAYEEAKQLNGDRDRRFRIEHAQHLTQQAIKRMARDHVIPAMQPYHAIDDGRWAEKRIGAERIKTTYPFRSLLDGGAQLSFGSDWTVAPISPLQGIYAAVTRQTIDGANPEGWVPEQKITVVEALKAYTATNAYAGFMENLCGTLEVGKLADFTVLSDDLRTIPPETIKDVAVKATVVGGQLRYGSLK